MKTPINMSKTKFMILNRQNFNIPIDISIQSIASNQPISLERSTQERILGVIVDEQLSFTPHMDHIVNCSFIAMNQIRDFSTQHLGLPTNLSILLYITNVRSIIESSYMCWSTINEEQLNRLDSIQGMMLKMIFRIKGKMSFNALNVEAGILPIKLRLRQILCNFACRIMRKDSENYFKTCLTKNIHRQNVGKFVTPADKIRMALSTFAKRLDISNIEPEANISKSIVSHINADLFAWNNLGNAKSRTKDQQLLLQLKTRSFLENLSPDDIICFTDGSVKDPNKDGCGACGAGVVIYNRGLTSDPISIPTPISSSSISYHGELAAIESALNYCKNMYGRKIVILSDCQSAIQSVITSKTPDSYSSMVNSIKQLSNQLFNRGCSISISWVGGHCNILGNELADATAKEACNLVTRDHHPYLTYKAIKSKILNNIISYWQRLWTSCNDGDHLKNLQPQVSLISSVKQLPNRKEQLLLHHLRLGRSDLNGQDPINRKDLQTKLCADCNEVENTSHYFLRC